MKKKISEFLAENFQFLVVKFSIYLNRNVFVMMFFFCFCFFLFGFYGPFKNISLISSRSSNKRWAKTGEPGKTT